LNRTRAEKARKTPHFSHSRLAFQEDINNAFTDYSLVIANMPAIGRDIRRDRESVMEFWARISRLAVAVREFVAPTYRPERHYMRGPGPACARRNATL